MRRFLMSTSAFTPIPVFAPEKGAGSGHSEDELAGLTEAERAGLEDADLVDDGDPAAKAAAAKEGDKKDDADAEETPTKSRAEIDAEADAVVAELTGKGKDKADAPTDDKPQVDKDAEAEAAKAAEAAAKPKTETKTEATTEEDKPDRSTVPAWSAPEDSKQKLADIATKKGELDEKFDAGDISASDYRKEMEALNGQEREIHDAQLKADLAHGMRVATWTNETVADFMEANPQYQSNETLNGLLDAEVRKLQVAANKEGKNPFSPRILQRAHANLLAAAEAMTGKTAAPPADSKAETKPKADAKPKTETKPRPDLPPSLAKVPASDATETGANRFANLDRLSESNPEAFQKALAQLPETVRDEYLASAQ